MAENINDIKKKVAEDWQNAFPQLVKYAQNKYYKIVGPLLVGIELIKLPRVEEYRPHFVIYSLWGNKSGKDLKACLSGPIILKEFFNKKGLQFSIPYTNHNTVFPEVLKAVKKQMPVKLDGETSIKKIYSAIEEHSKTPPLSAAPNSYLQASLQEYKLDIALCIGADKQVQEVFKQIKKRDWDLNHFAMFGINPEKWFKSLEDKINSKDKLLLQLSTIRKDKKLEKLQQSELTK